MEEDHATEPIFEKSKSRYKATMDGDKRYSDEDESPDLNRELPVYHPPFSCTPSYFTHRIRHVEDLEGKLVLIGTICGAALGLVIGYIVSKHRPGETVMELLEFPGEILLSTLRSLVVPLVTASLIVGTTALSNAGSSYGRMGSITLSYYLISTFVAAVSGLFWVNLIRPGSYADLSNSSSFHSSSSSTSEHAKTALETVLDTVRDMFPPNIVMAAAQMNVLGLITFSTALGLAIIKVGKRADPLKNLFDALNECIMVIVRYVIWFVPIGVCSLIISKLGTSNDFFGTLAQLGMFVVTVMLGLFVHTFILLPAFYFAMTRRNPFKLLLGMTQAIMIALGTSSSTATLPVTMKNMEQNLGVEKRITRFMLPLGATINMNGTALYEAMAAIFVAQSLDMPLPLGKMIITAFTATIAAVGAAGIPEAGLVTMVMVFTAIGLPLEHIGILFSIDWFLDRLRTACNVLGDVYGVGIVHHYEEKRKEREGIKQGQSEETQEEQEREREREEPSHNGTSSSASSRQNSIHLS